MAADPQAAANGPKLEGIEKARWDIYAPVVKAEISKPITNVKATVSTVKSEEKNGEDKSVENIEVTTNDGKSTTLELTCNICYEDYTAAELVEFSFNDKDWYLSNVCESCLAYYKEKKFAIWKEHILKPVCEASFKRLLKIGVITTMFDHLAFPSPEHEKAQYQVQDDNGKTVPIPRPVSGMRNWDPKNQKYKNINIHLKGAPENNEEKEKLWATMLDEFNNKYGKVMIDEWLKAK